MTPDDKERIIEEARSELGSAYDNLQIQIPSECERPSLVWRGDSIVLGSRMSRWALRAWLEEDIGISAQSVGFANLRPLELPTDRLRGYLHDHPVTADAFMAPPFQLRKPKYTIWPASDFGAFYGERLPEQITCFSMPYRQGGGMCAHACLYMCCVMLSRQNFRVPATHEVSFAVADLAGEIQQDGMFEVRGLTAREMEQVIKSKLIDGAALLEVGTIKRETEDDDRLRIVHFIQQYLSQGLPLILIIDCGKLYPEMKYILQARHPIQETFPHAVVLVGTRFQKRGNRVTPFPEAYVYHDPLLGPYLEKSVWELLSAARFKDYPDQVAFLVPVPKGVTVRMSDVRFFFILFTGGQGVLPRPRSLLARIWPFKRPVRQFALVAGENLEDTYFGDLSTRHEVRRILRKNLKRLPAWIWAVEVYHDLSRLEAREASVVWFFDATQTDIKKWPYGLFGFCQHEAFSCWLKGVSAKNIVVRGNLKVRRQRIEL